LRALALAWLLPLAAMAQGTAPADTTAPADSAAAVDAYLKSLETRTDESFRIDPFSLSDAQVDSLVRAWRPPGEGDGAGSKPRWKTDTGLAFRYNRVEGANLMPEASVTPPLGHRMKLEARGGYAWAAKLATWRGAVGTRLPVPGANTTLEAAHSREVYSYGAGGLAGNTVVALSTGRDYADYFVGEGWSVALAADHRALRSRLSWTVEEQSSIDTAARFTVFEGSVSGRPNPAVSDGTLREMELQLGAGQASRARLAADLRLATSGRGLGGDFAHDRVRAETVARQRLWLGDEVKARLTAGAIRGGAPWQALHHLGGTKLLRGYDINEIPARRFAHLSLDYALGTDFLAWVPFVRRLRIQAVPFFDSAVFSELQSPDGTVLATGDPQWRFSTGVGLQQNVLGIPGGTGQFRLDVARRLDREDEPYTARLGFTWER
jgi:hypothetical protein